MRICAFFVVFLITVTSMTVNCEKEAKKKKKDPRDYTDADIYKLEEEWTEDGDIDEGDLPEHLRKHDPIDVTKVEQTFQKAYSDKFLDSDKLFLLLQFGAEADIKTDDPESVIKMTKKHKTLMMFATVSGDPTEKETEEITAMWQSSLYNANIEVTRFVISSNRVLIKLADGSYAYEIKDFLIQQDRCESVTIEGQVYPGKDSPEAKKKKEAKKEKKKGAKTTGGKKSKVKNEKEEL